MVFASTLAFASLSLGAAEGTGSTLEKGDFRVIYDERGVTGLANPRDPFSADMVARGQRLGLIVKYRTESGEWQDITNVTPRLSSSPGAQVVHYTSGAADSPLKVTQTFRTDGATLDWDIELEAATNSSMDLSSWCLVNSGTPESNYGFWFPGKENDGAAGWQFMSAKYGNAWMGSSYPGGVRVPRGPWHYDGEIDLGFGGALRMAATVLTRDPIFDWFAYGGTLTSTKDSLPIIPRDGLRQRFHVILDEPEAAARESRHQRSADSLVRESGAAHKRQADKAVRAPGKTSPDATILGESAAPRRLKIELDRDGFAGGQAIVADRALKKISFILENRTDDNHVTCLWPALPERSSYSVRQDGRKIALKPTGNWDYPFRAELNVTRKPARIELVEETQESAN